MTGNVQISKELFIDIYEYFAENGADTEIMRQLNEKLDKLIDREIFTKYKRASSPAEREAFRNEYLDRKGISKSFRTATEIPKEQI